MKTYTVLLLIFCAAFAENLNAQCEVDAGENVHLCSDWWNIGAGQDSAVLNPQVISGFPPFNYSWETKVHLWDDKYLTASDFLSDTTELSPKVFKDFYPLNELVNLKLTATDSIGNVCRDSLKISVSSFVTLLVVNQETIHQGDTIFGSSIVGGGFEPLSVAWTPNYNISDTTSFAPLLWPDTSLRYEMLITDSVGCSIIDRMWVEVLTVNTENLNFGSEHFKTFPNPNKGIFFFEKTDKSQMNGILKLTDSTGKLVFSKEIKNQFREEIQQPDLASGIYFIRLFEKDKVFVGQVKIN